MRREKNKPEAPRARYSEKQSRDESTSVETRNLSPVCKWIEIIFYNRRKVQQPEVADK